MTASHALSASLQQRTQLSTVFNSRREAPLRPVSNVALYAWKPGQSTLQQFGVKACGNTPAPQKATNLLALHATLGAQFGTNLFAATALTTLPDPDTSNHSLQCDMFEPDPKHRGVMLRTELAPEWIKSERVEMDGLWRRGALEKVLRSSLDASARIFGSRFHYVYDVFTTSTTTCL